MARLDARRLALEDAVAFRDTHLEVLEKRLEQKRPRRPYPLMERPRILQSLECHQIPKR